MIEDLVSWLASDDGALVYYSVSVSLILGAFGVPIPEDIPLLFSGVAASKNIVPARYIFLVCYFSVLVSDQVIYFIGYFFGKRILRAGTNSLFFPRITEKKVAELRDALRRRRLLYIFIARHLFPVRSVTFLTAGALHIPFLEFLLADAFAALVSVSLVFGLGYYLGTSLTPELIDHIAKESHFYVGVTCVVLVALFVIRRIYKKARASGKDILSEESSTLE